MKLLQGDAAVAADRLTLLQQARIVVIDKRAHEIADALIDKHLIPQKAYLDALHVATAASAGIRYLLTLNCRHIANAHILPGVYAAIQELGFKPPLICTPAEFLGDPKHDFESHP